MKPMTVEVSEFAQMLNSYLAYARGGAEVTITKDGVPIARLVAPPQPTEPRTFEFFKGQITMAEDFDDPLPDEFWLGGNP